MTMTGKDQYPQYLALHNHKESMAWAATALYAPSVLALANFASSAKHSTQLATPFLMLMTLLAPLACSFVSIQMYLRWDAHWRTGPPGEANGINAIFTEAITYIALLLATEASSGWLFLNLALSDSKLPSQVWFFLPTIAAIISILPFAFRRSKNRSEGQSHETNRHLLLGLSLFIFAAMPIVLNYLFVIGPDQVTKQLTPTKQTLSKVNAVKVLGQEEESTVAAEAPGARLYLGEKMAQPTVNALIQVGGVAITLIAGFITLFINERSKRIEEDYKRKEERYVELINALRGFYVESFDREKRDDFLRQVNLCWLYCPDDVIQKAYKFLMLVHTDQKHPDAEKEKAVGEFMLAIRMDLFSKKPVRRTALASDDFKHLRAT